MASTPNLIMPGVAKCGTTTLHDVLVRHPEICGGIRKEIRFLMDEHDPMRRESSIRDGRIDEWRKEFPDQMQGDFTYWLDASPQYQYQKIAPKILGQINNRTRLLFVVRSPADRLFSFYRYAKYHQRVIDDVGSFEEFIDAIRTPDDPRIAGKRMLANAWEDSKYDKMLDRWMEKCAAHPIWLTCLESIKQDHEGEISALCRWLDIDPTPIIDMDGSQSNKTVHTRSAIVEKAGRKLAKYLPRTKIVGRLKKTVRSINSEAIVGDRKADNRDLLVQIDNELAPHTRRFNEMAEAIRPGFRPLDVRPA